MPELIPQASRLYLSTYLRFQIYQQENTLTEVEGVVKGGSDVVGKKSWGKGIRIAIAEDNSLTIGCNIIVGYGESVVNVAKAVQEAVANALESVTGVTVTDVNVNVCGIVRK